MDKLDKDLTDMSNHEIFMELKDLKYRHEALKMEMVRKWDELIELEVRFKTVDEYLQKRLNG